MQKKLDEKIDELRKCLIFEKVSEQSLYLISHELMREKKVVKGTLLCGMDAQSIFRDKLNTNPKTWFQSKRNSLSIENKDYELVKELVDIFDSSRGLTQRIKDNFLIESEDFYILTKGACEIRNPKNYTPTVIKPHDYFGANNYLGIMGYSTFGNIIAVEDCVLIYLPKESLMKIPEYDQIQMRESAKKNKQRIRKLIFQCAKHHGLNPYDIKWLM